MKVTLDAGVLTSQFFQPVFPASVFRPSPTSCELSVCLTREKKRPPSLKDGRAGGAKLTDKLEPRVKINSTRMLLTFGCSKVKSADLEIPPDLRHQGEKFAEPFGETSPHPLITLLVSVPPGSGWRGGRGFKDA